MAANKHDTEKLPEMFESLLQTYTFLENTDEPSNCKNVQTKIKGAIEQCENAVHMVNGLELFSTNEDLQEVVTNEIRFLMLPALLGYFTLKQLTEDRLENIKKSQVYYKHYITLCHKYGITDIDLPKLGNDETETREFIDAPKRPLDLAEKSKIRQNKIERFKKQKETERQLQELYKAVNQDHVDEGVKREYYTTLLKRWVNNSLEDLDSIDAEIPMLKHLKHIKDGGKDCLPVESTKEKHKPIQTFILTKTDLQRKVFGAGYPSIPTYTLEEFAEHQIATGNFPAPGMLPSSGPSEEEIERQDIEKEQNLEQDDKDELQKARDWDDWKDDHRRGWGNKQNMG